MGKSAALAFRIDRSQVMLIILSIMATIAPSVSKHPHNMDIWDCVCVLSDRNPTVIGKKQTVVREL